MVDGKRGWLDRARGCLGKTISEKYRDIRKVEQKFRDIRIKEGSFRDIRKFGRKFRDIRTFQLNLRLQGKASIHGNKSSRESTTVARSQ